MLLVCGASGLVGTEICRFFDENGIRYIGTYNNNEIYKPNMFKISYTNPIEFERFLLEHSITCCINLIVERHTNICENNWEIIKEVNVDLVQNISYLCNKNYIKLIHLSTDYVFDGLTQPNYPDSVTNPLQNYGISKLLSEHRVIKINKNYCIIRTPVLYSDSTELHRNAVCLIGKKVMDLRKLRTVISEDNYNIRRPLYIADLCKFIYKCVGNEYNGIYHYYNPYNKFTKLDICKKIGKCLNISTDHIVPNNFNNIYNVSLASSPYDTMLQDKRLQKYISDSSFASFDETIEKCFNKFNHPSINIQNKNQIFICLDMDETIIYTSLSLYNAYKRAVEMCGYTFISMNEWNYIIKNDNIDNYLKTKYNKQTILYIKQQKIEYIKTLPIKFTRNADFFLKYLIYNNFNFCIVTNSNKETVDIYKEKNPLLKQIKQWIVREDYNLPKPNSDCYLKAKQYYYKNELYIIGFEDSMIGYKALKPVTNIIYIYENNELYVKRDCYLFNDYKSILSLV